MISRLKLQCKGGEQKPLCPESGFDEEEDAKGTDGQAGLQAESTPDCNPAHTDRIFTFRPDLQTHMNTGHKQTCKAEPTLPLSVPP